MRTFLATPAAETETQAPKTKRPTKRDLRMMQAAAAEASRAAAEATSKAEALQAAASKANAAARAARAKANRKAKALEAAKIKAALVKIGKITLGMMKGPLKDKRASWIKVFSDPAHGKNSITDEELKLLELQ